MLRSPTRKRYDRYDKTWRLLEIWYHSNSSEKSTAKYCAKKEEKEKKKERKINRKKREEKKKKGKEKSSRKDKNITIKMTNLNKRQKKLNNDIHNDGTMGWKHDPQEIELENEFWTYYQIVYQKIRISPWVWDACNSLLYSQPEEKTVVITNEKENLPSCGFFWSGGKQSENKRK